MKVSSPTLIDLANDSPVLDRPAAARYLGVSPATLATWDSTHDVRVPSFKIGRRRLYRRADLDRFIQERVNEALEKSGAAAQP